MNTNKKYILTNETQTLNDGTILHRIKRLSDNLLGGWVEKESNLSHDGYCFVYDNAQVSGNAMVSGHAEVYDNARVCDNARVYGNAEINGNALIYGNAEVYDYAKVYRNAMVYYNAKIFGCARIYDEAEIYGDAKVFDYAMVYGDAWVYGNETICGYTCVYEKKEDPTTTIPTNIVKQTNDLIVNINKTITITKDNNTIVLTEEEIRALYEKIS